jgi:hypothetical protein
MQRTTSRYRPASPGRRALVALTCAILLLPGEGFLLAQEKPAAPQSPKPAAPPAAQQSAAQAPTPLPGATPETTKLLPEQLESLVAPIALYPDPLLAQTLVASTYPLEIIQLQQWLAKNKELKDKALSDAVAKQPWDPSIQSMAATPEVVKRLADDVQWTTDLGNAFLAQQADVMDAVQRMRKKAMDKGALETNQQQKVETQVVENKTVIVVQPANPEVIYVPSYSPTVVYGPPPYYYYPYPPIYYPPPPPPGAAFVAFSFGVMWGAAMWGGACCACGWHGGSVNINVHNNFNQINHYGGGGAGGNNWQHNPQHRGAAPYGDKATSNKYGGGSNRGGGPSASQTGGAGTRGGSPSAAGSAGGGANRGGGPSASQTGGAGTRGGSPSVSGGAGGGGDKVGNRSVPSSSGSKGGGSGFSGGSGGYSGSSARASSSRGASSYGGSRGGGGGRGGGGRGGGGRR